MSPALMLTRTQIWICFQHVSTNMWLLLDTNNDAVAVGALLMMTPPTPAADTNILVILS